MWYPKAWSLPFPSWNFQASERTTPKQAVQDYYIIYLLVKINAMLDALEWGTVLGIEKIKNVTLKYIYHKDKT